MPFPLPWFNNKVDPLLPQLQNIKPLLYAWDDYQTYDLLWYVPVQKALWDFLLKQFGANLPIAEIDSQYPSSDFYEDFISINRPIGWTFFERFTPWNYAWAEEYSTKFFHFIKQYCVRNYDIWETSVDYQQDTLNFEHFPNLQFTINGYKAIQKFNFSFKASEPQTIVLTWLEFQGWEVTKRYRIINLQKGENQITFLFAGNFCACSLVVSGEKDIADIEATIDSTNAGILYKNLDKLFKEISDRVQFKGQIIIFQGLGKIDYVPTPKWAYWARLTYANNNHWGNQIELDITKDLGKPIFFTPVYQNNSIVDLNCHLWGNYLYSVSQGTLDTYLPGTFDYFRSNIYSSIFLYEEKGNSSANYYQYSLFDEGMQEALNQQLESFLITQWEALPPNIVLEFLDAKKKLELQENA